VKYFLVIGLSLLLLIGAAGCRQQIVKGSDNRVNEMQTADKKDDSVQDLTKETGGEVYGAVAVGNADELTVEKMLIYSLEDEYKARAQYNATISKFGEFLPFSNIIYSEEQHISMLQALFERYGVEVPEDHGSNFVLGFETKEDAFKLGVQAEIENIDMYEKFLKQDLNDDVKVVFERLMNASKHHLQAFERFSK
jgi:hypothetical protein